MLEDLSPEEMGTRRVFRAAIVPRWFADFLWRAWLGMHRRHFGAK
jgi:hypothetical protein